MEEILLKFNKEVMPPFQCKWTPQAANIEAAEQYGYDFAQELLGNENCPACEEK